jgi:hypothetical protein
MNSSPDIRPAVVLLSLALLCAACRPPLPNPGDAATPLTLADTPRQVARAFNAACKRGDRPTALRLAHTDAPAERDLVNSAVDVAAALERLRNAVAARFGPDAPFELDFGLPYDEEFDDAAERITGDTALVVMAAWKDTAVPNPDGPGVTRLTRRAGQWLVETHPPNATPRDLRDTVTFNRTGIRAADQTRRALQAGKFKEPSDVGGALRAALTTCEH